MTKLLHFEEPLDADAPVGWHGENNQQWSFYPIIQLSRHRAGKECITSQSESRD